MRYARARRRRRELTTYLPHLREEIRKRGRHRTGERGRVMCLSYTSDITSTTLAAQAWYDPTKHFLTITTGDCMHVWLAVGTLESSVTAVRLWSEFKSSAPRWLLSICQLRGVCGRLSLRGSRGERERNAAVLLYLTVSGTPLLPPPLTVGIWSKLTAYSSN